MKLIGKRKFSGLMVEIYFKISLNGNEKNKPKKLDPFELIPDYT